MNEQHEQKTRFNLLALLGSKTVRLGLLLAVAGGIGLVAAASGDAEPGRLARLAPWAVRVGLALAGGYLVGWLLQRARGPALTAFGLFTATAVALRYFGVLDDPELQAQMKDLATGAVEGARQVKSWMYGLLPDGAAAGAGGLLGVRSKVGDDD